MIGLGLVSALVLLGTQGGHPLGAGRRAVSLEAAALIGFGYYLSQSAWLAGLGYWTLYRPLVAGLFVGAVLGDPRAGVAAGATINLAFLGFLGTGAALPTDMALVGFAGAAIALATGLSAPASLALALPLGWLGYGLYAVRLRWGNMPARLALGNAQRGDVRGIALCNVAVPQALLLLLAWVPGAAVAYLVPRVGVWLAATWPGWAVAALDLAGGLLAVLGVAAGLALVWTRRTAACYVGAAVVAVVAGGPEAALLAGVLGALTAVASPWVRRERPRGSPGEADHESRAETDDDIAGSGYGVRLRDRAAALLTWLFFSHSAYSELRLQGVGLAHALAPVLRRLYPARSDLARSLVRYLAPFNVEPNLGSAVVGVLARQEEAAARGQAASAVVDDTRARLAGPVSGVGDTVIHGAVGTAAVSFGIAVTGFAGPAGALMYSGVMAAVVWGISGWAFHRGYWGGFPGTLDLLRSDAWRRLVVGCGSAGAILLGVLTVGPVAGVLGAAMDRASVTDPGALVARTLGSLPAVALVLVFLAVQRWGLRLRVAAAACYAIGLAVALLRL